MQTEQTSVLVVGGGLTGLSAGAFLARRGVAVTLVERRGSALAHPRARAINPRSMETYRELGLTDDILRACDYANAPDAIMIRARTLAAPEQHRAPWTPPSSELTGDAVSPCPWAPISQHVLEGLVRAAAERLGADVRFGTEAVRVEAGVPGVRAVLRSDGDERMVRARYLIAADGHRSALRERLGIAVHGPGTLGHTVTFVFRADLRAPLRGRVLGAGHVDEPRPGTVLLPDDGRDRWVLSVPFDPERETPSDYDDARCRAAVRATIGVADLDVEVLPQLPDGTRVLAYEIGARVAERFRHGDVFLAGDAAHVLPPTGAFGASTGIQDAHNLAWRLAAVLDGQAGAGLLDDYEAERRPTAQLTLEQAMLQMRGRTGRALPDTDLRRMLDYDAVVFGYRYRSPGIADEFGSAATDGLAGDGDAAADGDGRHDPPALPPDRLRGQPGTRAPHVVLRRGGTRQSSLDLWGGDLVLLAGRDGARWARAAQRVAAALDVDLAGHVLGDTVDDVQGVAGRAFGIGARGALLVRPDGFVAWRRAGPVAQPERDLAAAVTRVLHRRPVTPTG